MPSNDTIDIVFFFLSFFFCLILFFFFSAVNVDTVVIQYTIKTLEKLKLFSLNVCLGLAKVIDQRMRMGELFLILCLESLMQGQRKKGLKN